MTSRTDRNDDLPLLRWTPPRRVIALPTARSRQLVREIADQLDLMQSKKARDRFWYGRCDEISEHLAQCGEDQEAINRHLDGLYHAVNGELTRRRHTGRS